MMKKAYHAPELEIEVYQLNASIASNCNIVVNMGPEALDAELVCQDYYEIAGETMPTARSRAHNIDFWTDNTCDCYYSAGGVFFTS